MKIKNFSIRIILIITILMILPGSFIYTGTVSGNILSEPNKTAKLIHNQKRSHKFGKTALFDFNYKPAGNDNSSSFVSESVFMKLNRNTMKQLFNVKDENILLEIPVSETESQKLELTRSYPLSDDFILCDIKSRNEKIIRNFPDGLHYRGIIKGNDNSVVSVSIFENFIMGIISDSRGNHILGSVKDSDNSYSDNYIYYNDSDLKILSGFKCGTDDFDPKFYKQEISGNNYINEFNPSDNPDALTVKIYFEADYQTYLDNDSDIELTADFIAGMFNSVAVLYQNEDIPVAIKAIGIWTVPDPYINLSESFDILSAFGELTQNDFEGSLAHLVSTRPDDLGGIAWIRVLCADYNSADYSGRYAFSNIYNSYEKYPVYSWTVNVVAHETGHNFGSKHTHACVWPVGPGGSIGAIDSCYYAEGNCFPAPRPAFGTIMSYCHLWEGAGGGVNFLLGFGPLPGDTIRLRYNQAPCLQRTLNSSEVPLSFGLFQNFPNPFNPETVIKFALPEDAFVTLKVYDISGRQVADIIENKFFGSGFYSQRFSADDYSLSSGIYFYRIDAGKFNESKRMVFIK